MKKLFEFREIILIFWLPIIILVVHAGLTYFKIYSLIWWIDIPMHFIGGVIIGRSYHMFLKLTQEKSYLGKSHQLVIFIFAISMVALTVTLWEFFEFSVDYLLNTGAQGSLANTMQDMFLGLLGGILGYTITKKI